MSKNGFDPGQNTEGDFLAQLATLLPGDVVEVWPDGAFVVKTVLLCREAVGERAFEWRWLFLDDGSLIEVSPDGYFRYREHRIHKQGSGLYEELVAQDGALVRFEERVRAGASGRRPVHVTIDGKEYRLTSTGTVAVRRLGDEPEPITWQSFSNNPEENVYFGLVETADEASVAIGLWTVHVCLSFGRPIEPSDVTAVYRKEGR